MTQACTMPSMTEPMDRQKLVGWIVRTGILDSGIAYTEASRRWPMALPTLNRLMSGTPVGTRFLRTAERNLGLPKGLLDMVIDGEVHKIQALSDLDEPLRTYILTELGAPASPRGRKRRA